MTDDSTNTVYCGVIERHLSTPTCPLTKYACMWCHKQTRQCMYEDSIAHPDDEKDRLSCDQFAAYVGLPTIPIALVNILKQSMITKLKKDV